MSENKFEMKKPGDLTRVNANDMGEVLWWSCQLGISPEKLFSLIRNIGDSSEKIKISIRTIR